MKRHLISAAAALSTLLAVQSASAASLVNGNLNTPATNYPVGKPSFLITTYADPYTYTYYGDMQSAALGWTLYNNSYVTATTSILMNQPGGFFGAFVEAGASASGLVQQFAPTGTNTGKMRAIGYVYLLSGKVSLTLGDGGSANAQSVSTNTLGSWVQLNTCGNSAGLNNEVYFYASGGPAAFYVDDVSVFPDSTCP